MIQMSQLLSRNEVSALLGPLVYFSHEPQGKVLPPVLGSKFPGEFQHAFLIVSLCYNVHQIPLPPIDLVNPNSLLFIFRIRTLVIPPQTFTERLRNLIHLVPRCLWRFLAVRGPARTAALPLGGAAARLQRRRRLQRHCLSASLENVRDALFEVFVLRACLRDTAATALAFPRADGIGWFVRRDGRPRGWFGLLRWTAVWCDPIPTYNATRKKKRERKKFKSSSSPFSQITLLGIFHKVTWS